MDKNLKQQLDAYLAENFIAEEIAEPIKKLPRTSQNFSKVPVYASMKFETPSLLSRINFEQIFARSKGETFSEMLMRLVKESGEKNSTIYNRAQVDRQLFSRIKKNKDYKPRKDTVVAFALALKLNLDKAKELLAVAGYTLTKSKRDLIISFFIEHEIFDTALLNDYLHEYNQPILFGR